MSLGTRRGAEAEDVKRCEIQPLLTPALPEVARFLDAWQPDHGLEVPIQRPGREAALSTERRLHWLLVDNPLTAAASQHGLCIRNGSGAIIGLLLSFPGVFLAGDQRVLGLCSSSFFVAPQARTQGFYLFRRYLKSPGYAFFFSTTCNAASAALWKTVGASAVPGSDTEYVLPLKLDVMLPAALTGRTSSPAVTEVARALGRWANPVLQALARKPSRLTLEPCRDWEKLAALFRRHRPEEWITADRSAGLLGWRYGAGAPNWPFDICVFRDERGHEGWFALGHVSRGRQGQIRGCVLLDAVWPRGKMGFREILAAILQRVASTVDAIFLTPRPGADDGACSRWVVRSRLEAPRVFAMTRKDGAAAVAVASLDLVPADGDGAF